ncbi:MAG: hypothetical protein ACTSWL_03170 [Promethearchaeota archaeon]
MEKLKNTEIDAYIPDRRKSFEEQGMKDNTLDKYHRNYFKYDEENDEFVYPEGKIKHQRGKAEIFGTDV